MEYKTKIMLLFLLFVGLFSSLSAVGFHTANEILSGTFDGDYNFTGNIAVASGNIVNKDNKVFVGNGLYLLDFKQNSIGVGTQQFDETALWSGNWQNYYSFNVDLPEDGKILLKGVFSFDINSTTAVYVRARFDDLVNGNIQCYIPFDANRVAGTFQRVDYPCSLGIPGNQPTVLSEGTHNVTIQLYMGTPGSLIFNRGGEGEGYNNVEVYGYDFEN